MAEPELLAMRRIRGVVVALCDFGAERPARFAVWLYDPETGKVHNCSGHYFAVLDDAVQDYINRR